jgi:hypothetical protein
MWQRGYCHSYGRGGTAKSRGGYCHSYGRGVLPYVGRQKASFSEEKREGKKRALRPPDSSSKKRSLAKEIENGFLRFWESYPRKVNEDDARAAFGKAIKAGAEIEAVVARAASYAVERAAAVSSGDNPKWTLYPATWLKKRKWKDPPPDGVVLDEHGNVVAIEAQALAREEDDSWARYEKAVAHMSQKFGGWWST